ncbi:hypothetical protein FSARC_15021, partial [Fusarium sarcochroum]
GTLHNACLTSKRLGRLAQTVLYYRLEGYPCDVIKTLSKSPHLCDMVHELDFPSWTTSYLYDCRPELQESFITASSRLGLPPALTESISARLSSRITLGNVEMHVDAVLAFWLALLPNLRSLAIGSFTDMRMVPAVIRHYLETDPTRFSLLRNVRLQPVNSEMVPSAAPGAIFLELPALEEASFTEVAWCEGGDSLDDVLLPATACQRLKTLTTEGFFWIQPKGLENLISTCNNLRSLTLEFNTMGWDMPIFTDNPFDFAIGDLLRANCQSLEDLTISITVSERRYGRRFERKWFAEQKWMATNLGSLQSLANLKQFTLGLDFKDLCGSKVEGNDFETPELDFVNMLPTSTNQFTVKELGLTDLDHLADSFCKLAESDKLSKLHHAAYIANMNLPRDVSNTGWTVATGRQDEDWRYTDMINEARKREIHPRTS